METWSEMSQLSEVESLPVDDRRKWKRLTTDSALSSPRQKNRPTSKKRITINTLFICSQDHHADAEALHIATVIQ